MIPEAAVVVVGERVDRREALKALTVLVRLCMHFHEREQKRERDRESARSRDRKYTCIYVQ